MSRSIVWLSAGVCALALAGSTPALADTLADAIRLAYDTNPTLQAQRAQLRSTDEVYVQARAGYRPTISATAQGFWQWQRIGKPSCTVFGCGDSSPETNQGSAVLNVTQPIYTGGRATAQVRTAEARVLAGREDLRRIEAQVMLSVIQAYVDVRRDEQSLEIFRDNVKVLQRQVDESRARFDVGEVTRTDVAQSEAQLAQSQSQLSSSQAQLANSRAAYATAVGQSPTKLEPEPVFKVFPETVEQAFDTAEQNNPSIRSADYSEQAAAAQVREARAQGAPEVSLQGSYGAAQPLHPFDTGAYTRTATAGVVITQPLFSGGITASQTRQAIELQNVARIQVEQSRRVTDQNVSQSWNQLLAARANITADEEQVRAARIAFEGTRAEQQVGLRTTLEVLNAQQVLETAELSLIAARHDEYLAAAEVLDVMGLLEAKNLVEGLDVQPGGHSFNQLKHTYGYVGVLEEGVQALDSVGAAGHIEKTPPPVDRPISTAPADSRPAPATPDGS